MKKSSYLMLLLIAILLLLGIWYLWQSSVYKAVAPGNMDTNQATPINPLSKTGWKTFTDTKQKMSFQYPDPFPTTYVHPQDWPPVITYAVTTFSCIETGSKPVPGKTVTQKVIYGHTYCVTIETEGAAGSLYSTYTVLIPKDNKLATMKFALKSVQCTNYDDPEKTKCMKEQADLNTDNLIDAMAQSIQWQE